MEARLRYGLRIDGDLWSPCDDFKLQRKPGAQQCFEECQESRIAWSQGQGETVTGFADRCGDLSNTR
jgi:hypothetical protein